MICIAEYTISKISDGVKGDTGVSVSRVVPQYYVSTKSTELLGGSWTETKPEVETGKYLWTRYKTVLENGEVAYSNAVCDMTYNGLSSIMDRNTQSIANKVWQSDISTSINTYDGNTGSAMRDRISQTEQDISGITTTVGDLSSAMGYGGLVHLVLSQGAINITQGDLLTDYYTGEVGTISYRVTRQELTADGLLTTVSRIDTELGNTSTIAQQASDHFEWLVKSGTSAADMVLTDNLLNVLAENINLTGKITFSSFTDGTAASLYKIGTDAESRALSYADSIGVTANAYTDTKASVAESNANAYTSSQITSTRQYVDDSTSAVGTSLRLYTKAAVDWVSANGTSYAALASMLDNWSYGDAITSQTKINGGLMQSHTVLAEALSVNQLSAITANVGTLTAGQVQSGNYSYTSGTYNDEGIIFDLNNGFLRSKNFLLDHTGNAFFTGEVSAKTLYVGLENSTHLIESAQNSLIAGTSTGLIVDIYLNDFVYFDGKKLNIHTENFNLSGNGDVTVYGDLKAKTLEVGSVANNSYLKYDGNKITMSVESINVAGFPVSTQNYAQELADDAAKTATNYLYYDQNNGLIVSETADADSYGYNVQIRGDGINLRHNTTTLAALTSDKLTFYKPGTTTVSAFFGANGLQVNEGKFTGEVIATSLSLGNGVTISSGKISGLSDVATSGAYNDLSGKPTLSTVATSGNYSDLNNKPTNLLTTDDVIITESINTTTGIKTTTTTVGSHTYTTYTSSSSNYLLTNLGIGTDTAAGTNSYFKVSTDGLLTAKNALIYGTVYATSGSFTGDITANSLTLGNGVTISSGKISGLSDVATSGSFSDLSGTTNVMQFGNSKSSSSASFIVSVNGKLTATNVDVSGKIVASEGEIGNWSINNGMMVCSSDSPDDELSYTTAIIQSTNDDRYTYGGQPLIFAIMQTTDSMITGGDGISVSRYLFYADYEGNVACQSLNVNGVVKSSLSPNGTGKNLGSAYVHWENLYVNYINGTSVNDYLTASSLRALPDYLIPASIGKDLGSSSIPWDYLYLTAFFVNNTAIIPTSNKSINLGTSSRYFNNAYINSITMDGQLLFYSWEDLSGTPTTRRIPIASASSAGNKIAWINSTKSDNTYLIRVRGEFGESGTFATYAINTTTSDMRLKTNIADSNVVALDAINKIHVREFDWIDNMQHQSIGFVADELEQIDPMLSIGGESDQEPDGTSYKSVNSFYLQGYAVKAIQELSTIVEQQQREIEELKRKVKV